MVSAKFKETKIMTTVITYGTFDLFHHGHVRLLKRLRDLGDRLIVGCSSDEFNAIKGKKTVIPYEYRREVLLSCRYVDGVFPENNWEQKRADIIREEADIFAMGDDWAGKFNHLSDIVKVIYLPKTVGISSTELKQYMRTLQDSKIQEIKALLERLNECVGAI
jgi:glycerol-3-phosphate cytidylyltransferase